MQAKIIKQYPWMEEQGIHKGKIYPVIYNIGKSYQIDIGKRLVWVIKSQIKIINLSDKLKALLD